MSKAAELAALIGSQTALSNRNMIINGAMQVAQRGTSVTGVTGDGYHALDRFKTAISSAGTFTLSQAADGPSGFSTCHKFDCTTAKSSLDAGNYILFFQTIEAQHLQSLGFGASGAKSITLSFYVKSNKTGTYIAELALGDATNASNNSQAYTINSANTWERKTLTYAAQTVDVINNDNGEGMNIFFWLGAGSQWSSGTLNPNVWANTTSANRAVGQVNLADSTSNEWSITGVQLELGEQATPFEHRSFGDELLACQRYYEHTYPYGTAPGTANGGIGADHRYVGRETASNYGYYTAHYRVEKRAAATVTVYSYVGTANQIANGDTGGDSGAVGVIQNGTTSFLPRNTSGSGVSARALMYHFKADAEL